MLVAWETNGEWSERLARNNHHCANRIPHMNTRLIGRRTSISQSSSVQTRFSSRKARWRLVANRVQEQIYS
ncbi:hypothetical protein BDZ89DRAFT_496346 [Hymenopellis radicata]|nr:hypothetical protein BDZ89DRAFT_496346 [Hymenopellis radicata]